MAGATKPVCVTVSALDAGHLTLPERLFITDANPERRSTVPSLSFLIQHPLPSPRRGQQSTKIVFDLGVKRNLDGYAPAQQAHISNRQPIITYPDCAASLRYGVRDDSVHSSGEESLNRKKLLEPESDIDAVILSHCHWDHVGTPSDFSGATFIVGSGTLDLLKNGAGPLYPAEIFNDNEVPPERTIELPSVSHGQDGHGEYPVSTDIPKHTTTPASSNSWLGPSANQWSWKRLAGFPHALDFFGDESLFIVDSPGHLYGHVNLLARVAAEKWVYLGGDCCHDPRILSGEKDIALYDDGLGGTRSVHVNTGVARRTLDRINEFVKHKTEHGEAQVEVVVAHDGEWRKRNRHRFWPGKL